MKISYNTLKSYLNIPLSVQEIGNILTEIGLEVEDIEKIGNHEADRWNGLIVAEVQSAIQHPNADRLRITQVNTGTEILQIVCGAPNVAAGQKVVLATIGTTLYPQGGEPFKIKKSKIRGEESNGMICAADEIGIGDDHSGILVLDENAVVGQAVQHFLNIPPPDTLITIGLTPNRSDAGAYIGIVKDVAAYVKTRFPNQDIQLNLPDTAHFEAKAPKTGYQVIIKDKERCTRYCGVLIKNVHIAPSPAWLQEHLTTIGIHPINNIVDITNFVLQESGQPLHAFDAAAIAEKTIVVQTLPQNTPFVTLDGTERRLQAGRFNDL
ncbi:MAG: phenylalanine--tRNA ligase subunit beta [Sphingobacteriales bacterium]|nr:phenylalanine--tRNA ligase subunit beta [Sphingobacteriales bacterium]